MPTSKGLDHTPVAKVGTTKDRRISLGKHGNLVLAEALKPRGRGANPGHGPHLANNRSTTTWAVAESIWKGSSKTPRSAVIFVVAAPFALFTEEAFRRPHGSAPPLPEAHALQ